MALKLYTVVDHRLDHGDQAAQSAHALAALALEYPRDFAEWDNQTLVLLKTTKQRPLHKIIEAAVDGNIDHATFTEPDSRWFYEGWGDYVERNFAVTAVAFIPNWAVQNILVKDLPLAITPRSFFG